MNETSENHNHGHAHTIEELGAAEKAKLLITEKERVNRVIEVIISVAASIITSAAVGSWWLSSTVQRFDLKIAEHEGRLNAQGAALTALNASDSRQAVEIARAVQQNDEVIRRLDRIEDKLDDDARRHARDR